LKITRNDLRALSEEFFPSSQWTLKSANKFFSSLKIVSLSSVSNLCDPGKSLKVMRLGSGDFAATYTQQELDKIIA
jgi:hypothetical protein